MGGKIMEEMRKQHGLHWVGVKFYPSSSELGEVSRTYFESKISSGSKLRFCEAIDEAIVHPVFLNADCIGCEAAKFIFGWSKKEKGDIVKVCQDKRDISYELAESMIEKLPSFKNPPEYIGINTDDNPDLAITYLNPQAAMNIVKIYHNIKGEDLNVSISSMMAICGSLALKSYITDRITLSFGCDDSRKYSNIDKDRLALCIPKNLFNVFLKVNPVREFSTNSFPR